MKLLFIIFALGCLVSSSLGNPFDSPFTVRETAELDMYGNTQVLVKELIMNLRNAALDAIKAVTTFGDGLQEQGNLFSEKILNDMNKFRKQIDDTVKQISDRFTGANTAVQTCINTFRKESDKIFAEAESKAKTCANERIQELKDMVENLRFVSSNATQFTNNALDELLNCNSNNAGLLSMRCFGGVAVRTELKGAEFLTQSGLLITRISFGMATLPPALEVCSGTRFISAGITSAKVMMDVGTCSATSLYSSLMGNKLFL